jgi:5-methylthioadenosine/S-adenosylhomocysteine deaminase
MRQVPSSSIRRQAATSTIFAYLESLDALGPNVQIAHAVWCTEADIKILAELQAAVSHNPVSNQYLASGVAPVIRMREAGVTVGLGTDGAASNNSQDLFEIMKAASLLQKVNSLDAEALTAVEALQMATQAGATALGLGRTIGTLEPGKLADIAVVQTRTPHSAPSLKAASTLVYCAKASDVQTVVVDGRLVMERGRVLTMDEDSVVDQGRDVARRIVEAAKKDESPRRGFHPPAVISTPA